MKKVAYTQIMGDYDDLKDPKVVSDGWDYICFTNNPSIKSNVWKVVQVDQDGLDDARLARKVWILNHQFVGDYDLSLMVGGQIEIRCNLDKFVKYNLPKDDHIDMSLMKHPNRRGVYEEAIKIISKRLDDPEIVEKQINKYKKEGMPAKAGLVACGIIIRKHNRPNLEKHCELWWDMVKNWSKRDQLSFNYIHWKYNLINYHTFSYDVLHGKFFKRFNHKGMKR